MTPDPPPPRIGPRPGSAAARTALDLASAAQKAEADARNLARALLPLLDAIAALRPGPDAAARADDLAGLAELAEAAAREIELEPVDRPGVPADPDRHLVVETAAAPGVPDGTVLRVARPGWLFRGRVLRPAHVVAARTTAPTGG